jgi:hypothetical protein
VTKITKADGGGYKAVFYSIDQGGHPLPIDKVGVDGSFITLTLNMISGKYEGKLSGDGKTIAGTWTQGPNPLPLPLTRATPETEWSIPPPVPPMAADANPNFEVAKITPSKPGAQGKGFFQGGAFHDLEYRPERPDRLCVWAPPQADRRCSSLVWHGSL